MPRPKLRRRLIEPPTVTGFIPESGWFDPENGIILHFEEYEAIKLADYDNLTQLEASERLQVSRPTFTRIYDSARKKVARAFVENKSISVRGGKVEFDTNWFSCMHCGAVYKKETTKGKLSKTCPVCASNDVVAMEDNMGRRRMHGQGRGQAQHFREGLGMDGNCICPKCDLKIKHEAGVPCSGMLCPKCDIRMVRENSEHHKTILKKRKK
jgi:predicted DNA-binding protein (UPF0251 family)/phage FluMu protein Com